jgi:5-methylthioribose kinase
MLVEAGFYEAVAPLPSVSAAMPRLLAMDVPSRCGKIEDLGASADCTDMYAGARRDLAPLVDWLSALHGTVFPPAVKSSLRNREMRALNHAHIFDLPISGEHGLDLDSLTPGLSDVAREFRQSPGIAETVDAMGEVYLSDGDHLLHGDFYPGSWLSTQAGLRVIDPEFCFFGPAEFDLGVFHAHLLFSGYKEPAIDEVLSGYRGKIDRRLGLRFAGIEIMRRLLGVGQLPMERTLSQKGELLSIAKNFLRSEG